MAAEQSYNVDTKKKVKDTTREANTSLFLLRCVELGISIADLDYLTIGMVHDMAIEKSNDNFNYAIKASQDDFDKF